MKHSYLATFLLFLAGCNPQTALTNLGDLHAPSLVSAGMTTSDSARLVFDEPLSASGSIAESPIAITSLKADGNELRVYFQKALPLDRTTVLNGRVKDERGNSCNFTIPLWGKNEHPATMLISECTTKGTKSQPDRVELLCVKPGSISGLTVSDGPPGWEEDRCVLPDKYVWPGTRIVIQFQAGGEQLPYHSSLAGLGSNNGCVVLLSDPSANAEVLDALVYSNRQSDLYGGWGTSSTQSAIERLVALGGWDSDSPSLAVDSTHSTSTRSMQRRGETDTDSASDWVIAPTGGASWGF
ncbi:MAG: hypothetical protein SPF89_00995 [Sphaerochaetaceae bacterium]|nr:hypothetical protein [Spirochaetales bacterium]MDY5498660.1 hypothetical protein [Sphaerochaetaceae bacterium]